VTCCQAPNIIEDKDSVSPIASDNEEADYPPMAFEGEFTPKRSNVTIKATQERDKLVVIEFGDEDIKTKPVVDSSDMDPTSEMLFLHYKLGHI
jgi:hypothetical protein